MIGGVKYRLDIKSAVFNKINKSLFSEKQYTDIVTINIDRNVYVLCRTTCCPVTLVVRVLTYYCYDVIYGQKWSGALLCGCLERVVYIERSVLM